MAPKTTNLTIMFADISGSTRLVRVPNVANSIVGVWAVSSTATLKTQHFTFLPDGRYFMWDPLGDSEGNNPGIKGGIEYGTYTYNATTGALTAAVAREADDTNGGAGIAGSTLTARLSTDGSTLTVPGGTPSATRRGRRTSSATRGSTRRAVSRMELVGVVRRPVEQWMEVDHGQHARADARDAERERGAAGERARCLKALVGDADDVDDVVNQDADRLALELGDDDVHPQ